VLSLPHRWASIAVSTLCVRAALAPLALRQARASAGVGAALAAARASGADVATPRGVATALAAHRAAAPPASRPPHPAWIIAAPLAQIPVFVTALLAVRRLALAPGSPLHAGGAAWAADLTLPALDAASWTAPMGAAGAALPAAATLLMFANIQAAFGAGFGSGSSDGSSAAPPPTRLMGNYKLALEWLLLPTLLAGLSLPHAVFAYWCVLA
jgi:YidC/Oxa1 family membrane protein insertase